ncbi:MAG TPA: 2-oxoglutarate and iron-dependent oxygenase domain-containing protein [Burkholderiales bacterium]|nr:2-oxoglutarate and iron-dependent oxygenase domain-containing protein [Burkholderiales bacterium]
MTYAEVKHMAASEIPVIDLAPLFAAGSSGLSRIGAEMLEASERIGFFYVRNHAVPRPVIDATVAEAFAFFRQPAEAKLAARVSADHRGFVPIGEAKMEGGARPDLKESFVWGLDIASDDPDFHAGALLAPNQWPASRLSMRAAFNRYFHATHVVAWRLMRAFAAALGLDEEHFVRRIAKPISRCSAVYYPAQPPESGNEQFGVAPHTDYGCLTLVYQANLGGLEVYGRDRQWVLAHRIEDTFVVNVGDLLARWTNDRFRSTPHRVVNRSGEERLSLATFADPQDDCVIEPVCRPGEVPRYEPVRCGDYIRGRFDRSFAYRSKS